MRIRVILELDVESADGKETELGDLVAMAVTEAIEESDPSEYGLLLDLAAVHVLKV